MRYTTKLCSINIANIWMIKIFSWYALCYGKQTHIPSKSALCTSLPSFTRDHSYLVAHVIPSSKLFFQSHGIHLPPQQGMRKCTATLPSNNNVCRAKVIFSTAGALMSNSWMSCIWLSNGRKLQKSIFRRCSSDNFWFSQPFAPLHMQLGSKQFSTLTCSFVKHTHIA